MFKHILIPTDFGDAAEHALDVGIELATRYEAKLTLLHVYQLFVPMPYTEAVSYPFQEVEKRAQKVLDENVARAAKRYARCEGVLRPGTAADEIVTLARELGADLIVMGTHGRRGVSRALIGSVAERVVRTSPVPVLTLGARTPVAR
jgi:nucleotide-binding universal stress UspA family protein